MMEAPCQEKGWYLKRSYSVHMALFNSLSMALLEEEVLAETSQISVRIWDLPKIWSKISFSSESLHSGLVWRGKKVGPTPQKKLGPVFA